MDSVNAKNKKPAWKIRTAVAIFALAVRLIAGQVWSFERHGMAHVTDEGEYLSLGYHLRHFHELSFGEPHKFGDNSNFPGRGPVVPTAARAPLYPMLIAALWNSSQPPLDTIAAVQAIFGALTALLVFEMGVPLFGSAVAIIAAFAYCLAPSSVQSTAEIWSEPLFTLLMTAALYCWITDRFKLAGIAFGLSILTRPVLLPFVILLLLICAFRRYRSWLPVPVLALLVVVPWTMRNLIVLHQPTLVNTEGWGSTLLQGSVYVPFRTWVPWSLYMSDPPEREAIDSTVDESAAEHKMFSAAIARIGNNPVYWLWIRILQYPRLYLDTGAYFSELRPGTETIFKVAFIGGNALFLAIAAIGVWIERKRREILPLILLIGFWVVIHFPGIAQPRYSLPIVAVLVLFAGSGMARVVRRLTAEQNTPAAQFAPARAR